MNLLNVFRRRTLGERIDSDIDKSDALLNNHANSYKLKLELWRSAFRKKDPEVPPLYSGGQEAMEVFLKVKGMIEEELGESNRDIKNEEDLIKALREAISEKDISIEDYRFAIVYQYEIENDVYRLLKKIYDIALTELDLLNFLIANPGHKIFYGLDNLITYTERRVITVIWRLLNQKRQNEHFVRAADKVLFGGHTPSEERKINPKEKIRRDSAKIHRLWVMIENSKLTKIIESDRELEKFIRDYYPLSSKPQIRTLIAGIRHNYYN